MKQYDLIVIGTGPAGEKAAVKAAYFGHKVAIIEKSSVFGGAEVVTGTLPSKTLKETSLYLSGKYEKGLYGVDRDLNREASIEDFMFRKNYIIASEGEEIHANLLRHNVDIYHGLGSFETANQIRISSKDKDEVIEGKFILIATGSYPFHPPEIPFDHKRVHDSDTILDIERFPNSIAIVGAGVIGCEYATIFATMGTKVSLINNKDQILSHVDNDITKELVFQMENSGVDILFNTSVESMHVPQDEKEPIEIKLKTGELLKVDMFLYAAGRSGNTKSLQIEKIGLKTGKRETLVVDEKYRTNVPHIYAAGDVIGFPSLACTSMEQGRLAVSDMFKIQDIENFPAVFPFGIYTIPEVSMVGMTEEDAKEKGIDSCSGKARYVDMPRGKIMGAQGGFLKLIFDKKDHTILGVHIIGHIATELIHYGVQLVENKKTLDYVIGRVYNYPTLHDLYKYAAYDGLGNSSGHKIKQ